jgi:hypothetical protein
MASGFAEFCLHIRQLRTRIARFAFWINIPLALLNYILVQFDGFGALPTHVRPLLANWILSLVWLVMSVVPLMLLAESWEMWWNPFARDAYARENSKMSESTKQKLLEDNRRIVRRAFCLSS